MGIRTVGDLCSFLESHARSPEELAELVGISNMTIRRLLKKKPGFEISRKYWPLFEHLEPRPELAILKEKPGAGFAELLEQIETEGSKCKNPSSTVRDATKKVKAENLGNGLLALVRELGRTVVSKRSVRRRAIAVGALLYFLNPIDLIPDSIPVFGYLDDFAVMSLAVSMIRSEVDDNPTSKKEKRRREL